MEGEIRSLHQGEKKEKKEYEIKERVIVKGGILNVFGKCVYINRNRIGTRAFEIAPRIFGIVGQDNQIDKIYEMPLDKLEADKRSVALSSIPSLDLESLPDDLARRVEDINLKLKSGVDINAESRSYSNEEISSQYRDYLIEVMEKQKIVEYGEDGEIVCDLEALKKINYDFLSENKGQDGDVRNSRRKNAARNGANISWQKILFDIFYGHQVYSKEDYQKKLAGEAVEPKPLFYSPLKEQAFDIEAIKKASFYLAPEEISGKWDSINPIFEDKFGYGAEEANLALIIYHPNYGNGRRDGNGRLLVRKDFNSDKDNFGTISYSWMIKKPKKHRVSAAVKSGRVDVWNRPRESIKKEQYKNLRSSGLLTEDDFRSMETTVTGEKNRRESVIDKKGNISVNTYEEDDDGSRKSLSVRYLLGVEFSGKKLVKLEDNLYGIVTETQGQKEITHVFRPNSYQDIQRKYQEFEERTGKKALPANIYIGKRDADFPGVMRFSETKFMQRRRDDESDIDYAKRIATFNAVKNYNKLEKLSDVLSEEAGIGLHNMTIREQNCLTTYAFSRGDETFNRLVRFCKNYGEKGIRTFLSCEFSTDMGEKILELGQGLPEETAASLFSKYAEIADAASESLEEMIAGFGQEVDKETRLKIEENLLKRAKDLLDIFYLKMKRGEKVADFDKQLGDIKSDIMLFTSTFKTLYEAGTNLDFKELAKVSMETKKPADLSPAEKEEMVRIFLANREEGYPEELLKNVFSDFEQSINPEDDSVKAEANFIILKYAGNIVSFLRLEPRGPGRLYAAAFNTRPEAKGFKIGNAMMKEVIEGAAKENTIEAVAYSKKPQLLAFYKNFFGFKEIGETEIAGERFIKIEKTALSEEKNLPEAA